MLRKQHELAKLQHELVADEAQQIVAEVHASILAVGVPFAPSFLILLPLFLPSLHLIFLPSIQIQPLAIPAHALHTLTSRILNRRNNARMKTMKPWITMWVVGETRSYGVMGKTSVNVRRIAWRTPRLFQGLELKNPKKVLPLLTIKELSQRPCLDG